jgi:hypothetical protein
MMVRVHFDWFGPVHGTRGSWSLAFLGFETSSMAIPNAFGSHALVVTTTYN